MKRQSVIISILNAKGGVGKTCTTVNLGAGLARAGYSVLAIDIDLQANLTQSLIGPLPDNEDNIAECLVSESGFDDIIRHTSTTGLDLVPAGDTLMGIDLDLSGKTARESILKSCIERTRCLSDYDIILIDNPPYISLATINSITASTHYLIPVSCEFLPMVGIKLLNERIEECRDKLNPDLELLGVVFTMYDKRIAMTEQVEGIIKKQLGDAVFNTVIRVNAKMKSTPISKTTIFQFEESASGKGTEDYTALTDEVISRLVAEEALEPSERQMVGNG